MYNNNTLYYLDNSIDIDSKEGGVRYNLPPHLRDVHYIYALEYDLYKVFNCGQKKLPYRDKNNKVKLFTIRCQKQFCPRCGKKEGFLHNRRIDVVTRRLGHTEGQFYRYFVFTIPQEITSLFYSREMLNRFFEIVRRIIQREFGKLNRIKQKRNKRISKYDLKKKVLATLELFNSRGQYHPHINVLIFEDKQSGNAKRVSPEMLNRIKASYKRALSKISKRKVEVVDVYYRYYS
jgi:hypothetical protein